MAVLEVYLILSENWTTSIFLFTHQFKCFIHVSSTLRIHGTLRWPRVLSYGDGSDRFISQTAWAQSVGPPRTKPSVLIMRTLKEATVLTVALP